MRYSSGESRGFGSGSVLRTATVGGAILGAAILTDRLGGDVRWQNKETSLQFEGEVHGKTDVAWVVFPGLGQKSSSPAARAIGPSLDAPVISMNLPQRGPRLRNVQKEFARFITEHEIQRLRTYCTSMGLFLAADLLPALPAGIDIDAAIFDHSPGASHHAKQGDRVPKIISRLGYPGGLLTKPIAAALGYQPHPDKPDEVGLKYNLREAWKSVSLDGTPNGSSTMLWVWQAQRLCDPDHSRLERNIGSRLTPDARLAYIMPDPPERDVVVDNVGSIQTLESVFGREIDRIQIEGISHAWPTEYTQQYQMAIGQWLGRGAFQGAFDSGLVA